MASNHSAAGEERGGHNGITFYLDALDFQPLPTHPGYPIARGFKSQDSQLEGKGVGFHSHCQD